ncbi:MAG: hypothetical protein U0P30_09020 [Vicinamibacterales bacterium]
MTRIAARVLVWAAVACLYSGCILVGDFGALWNRDALDGALAGRWVSTELGETDLKEMAFVRRGNAYGWITTGDDIAYMKKFDTVRTVRAGGSSFLLLRAQGVAGGMMVAYRVTRDRLELLAVPDVPGGEGLPPAPPSVDYTGHSEVPPTVRIKTLDLTAVEWLAALHRLSTERTVFVRRR